MATIEGIITATSLADYFLTEICRVILTTRSFVYIAIDESGSFVGYGKKNAISLVGALVIPHAKIGYIEKAYSKLRRSLPKERGEVKGRLLNEKNVSDVVEILLRNSVLFDASMIDLQFHTEEEVLAHRNLQAERITSDLKVEHHASVHEKVWDLRLALEKMPPQLHIQSQLNFILIKRLIQDATNYHCQRDARELGKFTWVVDAKGKVRTPSKWEEWWQTCMLPLLQSSTLREPSRKLREGDWRYFERFLSDEPLSDYIKSKADFPIEDNHPNPIDLKKLTEDFSFSSSSELGLELVDIIVNATRRAMVGNLRAEGWGNIPKLMLHRNRQYIEVAVLTKRPVDQKQVTYAEVMRKFRSGGRSLLIPTNRS